MRRTREAPARRKAESSRGVAGGARDAASAGSRAGTAAAAAQRTWPVPVLLALVLVAAVVLYVPALRTSFFADDYLFLDQVRQKSLIEALRTPDPLSNFYRPISRQLYFWTVAGASNESPFVFHVVGLACFLVLLALLFGLARRMAGTYAATCAASFVALHYTADVPIRWACGSQELLSVIGALAALWLHLSGRTWLAAAAMAFAALSKEVVLLTPLIATIADRRTGESLLAPAKRAWPLGIGVAVWAAVWLLAPQTRQAAGTEIEINLWSPIAAFVHLAQVFFGAEARTGELWRLPTVGPPWVPLVLVAGALFLAGTGGRLRRNATVARQHAIVAGIAWALLATIPVIAVAILWTSYYYLFAMCGAAIALGAWLSGRPRAWAIAAIALLAWGSNSARHVQEFASPRDPWTTASHINKFYIERANRYCERYLEDLKRQKPHLPDASTLFFAGLKGNVAFQVANGPLMRWAYRDTSVRSYYLNDFTLDKARRGPNFYFIGTRDSLRQMEPGEDLYARIGFSMLINGSPRAARDALLLQAEREPGDSRSRYWLAWCEWALGDTVAALRSLQQAGFVASREPAPETATAVAMSQGGRVREALGLMQGAVHSHALDPMAHALLADLSLVTDAEDPAGPVEAFAARTLAPADPLMWRRWASIQMHRRRFLEALGSFERYFELAGPAAAQDGEALQWVAQIKAMLPGGDLAQEGSKE